MKEYLFPKQIKSVLGLKFFAVGLNEIDKEKLMEKSWKYEKESTFYFKYRRTFK